jgi:protein O-GlcNAc transferase
LICDWDGIEAEENELRALMAATGSEPVHFFAVVGMGLSAAGNGTCPTLSRLVSHSPRSSTGVDFAGARKLRIGYLSADFRRHATALLMAELFERHDKSCFEIVAYSHGPVDRGELSARLRAAFDDLVDIRAMTDVEAARRITADRIDILVELKGYTKGARTGIAAQRPAPVQESFVP